MIKQNTLELIRQTPLVMTSVGSGLKLSLFLNISKYRFCILQEFPESGCIPRYSILKKQGYRVLITERHLVFYKINEAEKLVTIYAIVEGRREYLNLV